MFSSIWVWNNSWVNNGDVVDLRRHRFHHDASVTYKGLWARNTCNIKVSAVFTWRSMIWSGHNFAHATTDLLWHVQNCDLIWWLQSNLELKEFKICNMNSKLFLLGWFGMWFDAPMSVWLCIRAFPVIWDKTGPCYDAIMTWMCAPHYWPFMRGIHWWLVASHWGPVMQSFDFFVVNLNKLLNKLSCYNYFRCLGTHVMSL